VSDGLELLQPEWIAMVGLLKLLREQLSAQWQHNQQAV